MKVSVILTSYNHENYIRESIESVLNQSFTDFELIIIDDHSTDNSWSIIKSYKDDRIRAFRNEKNIRTKGFHNAIRNIARGQYIAIHHSDDVWELDKLEKQVEFLDKNLKYAACFTRVKFIDETSSDYVLPEGHIYKDVFIQPNKTKEEWLRYFFYNGNCLCHPSVLIRKDMYEKCKMLDMYGLAQLPDFYKWIKLCLHEDIFILPDKLIKFRISRFNDENTSSDKPEVHIRSQIELYYLLREYRKLKDITMFMQVFPSAEEYYLNGGINLDFALAKICLNTNSQPHQLLGINILFELINNPILSVEIENIYGYTGNDLINDTAKHDIFALSRIFSYCNSSIFIDFGNGFNENDKLTKQVYIRSSNDFYVKFNLNNINNGRKIKNIRFDIDEGKLLKCYIKEVYVDGTIVNIKPLNASFNQDNYNVFLTIDPIYIIDNDKQDINVIEIIGSVKKISNEDIKLFIDEEINKQNQLIKENEIIINKYDYLIKEKENWNLEKNKLIEEKEEELIQKNKYIEEKEKTIFEQNHLIEKNEKEINYINSLLQKYKEDLNYYDDLSNEKNKEISNLQRSINEKDIELKEMKSIIELKSLYINEIEKNILWKIILKIKLILRNILKNK